MMRREYIDEYVETECLDDLDEPLNERQSMRLVHGPKEFDTSQANGDSAPWWKRYEERHWMFSDETMRKLGLAKLEWVLMQGKESLIDVLTPEEFFCLCGAHINLVGSPDSIYMMERYVFDEYAVSRKENGDVLFSNVDAVTLFHKVQKFSAIEKLVLSDAMDIFWASPDRRNVELWMMNFGLLSEQP